MLFDHTGSEQHRHGKFSFVRPGTLGTESRRAVEGHGAAPTILQEFESPERRSTRLLELVRRLARRKVASSVRAPLAEKAILSAGREERGGDRKSTGSVADSEVQVEAASVRRPDLRTGESQNMLISSASNPGRKRKIRQRERTNGCSGTTRCWEKKTGNTEESPLSPPDVVLHTKSRNACRKPS